MQRKRVYGSRVLGLWEVADGAGAWAQRVRSPPARGGDGTGAGAEGGGQAAWVSASQLRFFKISSKYSLFVLFIYCCQNLVFYYEDNLNVKSNSVTTRLST